MKFTNVISGAIILVIGILMVYIDYYIVSTFYSVALWISSALNAPAAVTVLITLILVWIFIGIILLIAIIATYLFIIGLSKMLEEY